MNVQTDCACRGLRVFVRLHTCLCFVCLLVTVAVEWFPEGDIEIFFSIGNLLCKWQRNCESVVTGTSGQDFCCLLGTLHLCCKFFFFPSQRQCCHYK